MLLANYTQQNRNTISEWGSAFSNPHGRFNACLMPKFYCGDHVRTNETDRSSWPNGYNTHSAWWLAPKAGGIAAVNSLRGTGGISGTALAVLLAQAALSGSGGAAGAGGLIVQLIAALSGSGGVTSAAVDAFLAAVANLTGSGGISAATATGLGELLAALSGSGGLTGSTATGTGALSADLTVTGAGLSTANVAQAVWSAAAASNDQAGTMGEKLNDAGSAANPWTEVIESGYTAAQILQVLAAFVAGKTTIDASGSPVLVTFRDLGDTKDRITGEAVGSERTSVTLDVD